MPLDFKSLADGQLAAAKATIYTCPAAKRARVEFIRIYNTSGAVAQAVSIYVKRSGSTSKTIYANAALAILAYADCLGPGQVLTLSAGDVIEGVTTTATNTDYVITGLEGT